MKIIKSPPGQISKNGCWCCFHDGYLYIGETLEELVEVLNTQWEWDLHLVG